MNIERAINTIDCFVRNHHTSLEVEAWQTLKSEVLSQPDVQQLKQAIALVRQAAKRDLYNNEQGFGFEFCLNIIEQRACV